jgi:signal transduction histidine kinase
LVEVEDRGIGMDEADQQRLFTPFFRSDRSRSRGTGGVGLGLALSRRIVEAHGGTVIVESSPGKGTTVSFTVPTV